MPTWTILKPELVRATQGTTLTAKDDGSILASGEFPDVETYTVTVKTNLKNITAFRLEALADPSLPNNGPGTAPDGNFMLSEFKVAARAGRHGPIAVAFSSVVSDYSARNSDVNLMVDEDAASGRGANAGWSIRDQTGMAHAALFELSTPLRVGADTVLVVTIESHSTRSPKHHLGRFRLLATSTRNPTGAGALPPAVVEAVALPAAQRTAEQQQQVAEAHRQAAPWTARPVHGLTGRYFDMFGYARLKTRPDEFRIPAVVPGMAPIVTRIDAQLAFGKGNGFEHKPWAAFGEYQGGGDVVWNGYIHLPTPGTYYILTASKLSSAVFINGCRVALNGNYGGTIVSDAFSYADDTGAGAGYDSANGQYVLPVTVAASRVFPIEIRYKHGGLTHGAGIDLYWVTPDSPKGSDGKPIAQLVPTEALYVDLPEGQEIEEPQASAAHCSISSDRIYLSDGGPAATLTVRIADRNGRGLPGRRVHIHQAGSSTRAELAQPTALTDEHGVCTAIAKPVWNIGHCSFYATDLTDLVSVPQVCHTFNPDGPLPQFFPWGSTPYFDSAFDVSPKPMVAGKPVTIRVPLTNRTKATTSIYVAVDTTAPNIGAYRWNPVGKSEAVTLAPGASSTATISFTLGASNHVCFRLVLWGKPPDGDAALTQRRTASPPVSSVGPVRFVLQGHASPANAAPAGRHTQGACSCGVTHGAHSEGACWCGATHAAPKPLESRQQNIGPVVAAAPSGPVTADQPPSEAFTNDSESWNEWFKDRLSDADKWFSLPPSVRLTSNPDDLRAMRDAFRNAADAARDRAIGATDPAERAAHWEDYEDNRDIERYFDYRWDPNTKENDDWYRKEIRGRQWQNADTPAPPPVSLRFPSLSPTNAQASIRPVVHVLATSAARGNAQVIDVPKAASYRQLAAASADTVEGHSGAVVLSQHRYRAAEQAGEKAWADKHFTAIALHKENLARAARAAADQLDRQAKTIESGGDARERSEQRTARLQRVAAAGLPADEQAKFDAAGLDAATVRAIAKRLLSIDAPMHLSRRQLQLAERAAILRTLIRQIESDVPGKPRLASVYTVFNPKDTDATVTLLIRPATVPPDCKLSVIDAEPQVVEGKLLNRVRANGYNSYAVNLPARGQMKVASVIEPGAEMAQNTTARWGVEGYIGSELLGGMMHEMVVPAFLPDLELPPVGSGTALAMAEAPAVPAAAVGRSWWPAVVTASVLSAAGVLAFIWLRRRRRRHPAT